MSWKFISTAKKYHDVDESCSFQCNLLLNYLNLCTFFCNFFLQWNQFFPQIKTNEKKLE